MNTTLIADEFSTLGVQWSWREVLRAAALVQLGLLLATMVALRDVLAAGLAVILVVGLAMFLLRGRLFGFFFQMIARVIAWRIPEERVGALILGFLFADIGFYTLTGTASNLWNGIYGAAIFLPASLAATSLLGFVAALMCVFQPERRLQKSRAAVNLVSSVVIVWCVVMGVGLLGGARTAQALPPSDVHVITENMAFSNVTVDANSGVVRVELENHDLFWHTFTIEELGVDLKVPVGATQQVVFDAPSGTYRFVCTIPGHELLGMSGTLVVR